MRNMRDVRNVEMVFKDGVACDPAALVAGAQGGIGAFDWTQLLTWRLFAVAAVASALVANRARRRTPRAPRPDAI